MEEKTVTVYIFYADMENDIPNAYLIEKWVADVLKLIAGEGSDYVECSMTDAEWCSLSSKGVDA